MTGTSMKPNRMKEKIARGEPALGCSVMILPQIEMLGLPLRLGAHRLRARQTGLPTWS
jgi:hypothetical protein